MGAGVDAGMVCRFCTGKGISSEMVGLFQPASQPERLYLPESLSIVAKARRDGGAFRNAPTRYFLSLIPRTVGVVVLLVLLGLALADFTVTVVAIIGLNRKLKNLEYVSQ